MRTNTSTVTANNTAAAGILSDPLSNGNSARNTRRSQRSNANSKTPGRSSFHPRLITSQIVALQCFHYFILAFFIQVNHALYGTSITMDRIFSDQYLHLWHSSGWPDVCAIFLSSLLGAVLLAIIVEKSKKCLDFALTLFMVHLFLVIFYHGFPKMEWWIVHICATIVMILLGEYVCSRKELDEIPLLEL